MTFDIRKLAIGGTADYHVTDAAGNPQYDDHPTERDDHGKPVQVPVVITVISPGTKKGAAAEFKRQEARSNRLVGGLSGKTSKRTEDDEIKERADFLASITHSMGFDFPGGATALYKDLPLGHIADGVEKFYGERGNFMAGSPTASANMSDTQPG